MKSIECLQPDLREWTDAFAGGGFGPPCRNAIGPPRSVCEGPQGPTATRSSPGGVINVSVWRVELRGAPLEDPM